MKDMTNEEWYDEALIAFWEHNGNHNEGDDYMENWVECWLEAHGRMNDGSKRIPIDLLEKMIQHHKNTYNYTNDH